MTADLPEQFEDEDWPGGEVPAVLLVKEDFRSPFWQIVFFLAGFVVSCLPIRLAFSRPVLETLGERGFWIKLPAAAAFGALFSAQVLLWKGADRDEGPVFFAIMVALFAAVGVVAVALLHATDAVNERLRDGRPVAFPLRVLLSQGVWSILVWIFVCTPALLFGTFLAATLVTWAFGLG
ncbi:hypothetical protein CA12_16780 [Alienimonas californiensis]|uniref:Uncharacterized protein n=1 Tax=Alienimonas californiensis TaxID=2527989 RepID=A0A517P8A4_9PLAN|nr:hypothetical protein CA12_16780 [Alienimonas californiensis]